MADAILEVGEDSPATMVIGKADIIIQGLTEGSIRLQYKMQPTENYIPIWRDFPDGSFTEDTFKTFFISEHSTLFRLLGVGNNAGAYVRIGVGGGAKGIVNYSLNFSKDFNSFYIGVL